VPNGFGERMMVGPHFSAGRAMLAHVYYDHQVPSPPSLLKVRHQSVRLSDQPVLFWSGWGKSSYYRKLASSDQHDRVKAVTW